MSYLVEYLCLSHVGKCRSVNQDNYICEGRIYNPEFDISSEADRPGFDSCNGMISGCVPLGGETQIFGVFDGMGGEEQGEIAALLAVKSVASACKKKKKTLPLLEYLAISSNQSIYEYAQKNGLASIGTTAVLLGFGKKDIGILNLGDSKAFQFSNDKLLQISVDHISPAPYGVKPPLTQYLGYPRSGNSPEPYIAKKRIVDGDIYLLCSDGLTDMVPVELMESVIGELPFETAGHRLMEYALEKGGRDNITLILCRVFCNGKRMKRK